MHKIGTLDDADLVKAYMDLGFDREKAEKMRDFTIQYNFRPPSIDQTEEDTERAKQKDLTKADVLNGYYDGLLTPGETDEVLDRLGYSEAEIVYYKSRVDFERDTEEVDSQINEYHDLYVYYIIEFNEAQDKLGELNLPAERVERLFRKWDIERRARASKPTKSELMTFLRKGTIKQPVFIEEMKGLRYSDKYIGWYLKAK
ncbi:unnamed protein product [marine sediment metagenome]|uniref:Uncharacterized protein n=1 Tax=marine sediment metagenome TaxID=412755 RepID=X1QBM3_9ZZZZ